MVFFHFYVPEVKCSVRPRLFALCIWETVSKMAKKSVLGQAMVHHLCSKARCVEVDEKWGRTIWTPPHLSYATAGWGRNQAEDHESGVNRGNML